MITLMALPIRASADVIHLKNGRTIWADRIRENGIHIEYDVGEDTYAVLKSSVDHIETGGIPPGYGAPVAGVKNQADIPSYAPNDSYDGQHGIEVAADIIQNGAVNPDALSAVESKGDDKTAAATYYVAGKNEFDRGNFSQARKYFERALHFEPDNPAILNYYASLLVRSGDASEALSYAERAVRVAPNSPDTLAVLGYAQFASDRNRDAIASWKHSLELRPDAQIKSLLEKAEREASTEADFSQRESSHFTLRYEGKQTSDSLRAQLIGLLEADYDDLVRQLGVAPRSSIPVVLYTDQAFFDVTQAPSWTGAVNDGKLRIPVQGLNSVTPELAHVLKHELTHSFVNQISAGRCPQWLNEGIAQAMEPKSVSAGRRLSELFHAQHEIPFNELEGSFMRFSGMEANLAYDESLAAVQYINDNYGISDLQRILQQLGQGSSTEAALRSTIHTDYAHLDEEVGQYLTAKYGN